MKIFANSFCSNGKACFAVTKGYSLQNILSKSTSIFFIGLVTGVDVIFGSL
jgi:hypothetical protein